MAKITVPFSKQNLINLTSSEWKGVQKLIKNPGVLMVYDHEKQAKALIAVGTILNASGLGILRMHIFHNCQPDPVKIQNFTDGFASGKCPVCKTEFEESNTEYDLELIVKYGIELVD